MPRKSLGMGQPRDASQGVLETKKQSLPKESITLSSQCLPQLLQSPQAQRVAG